MANDTQDQCKQAYKATVEAFLANLELIDMKTPAQPDTEPTWWSNMMDVARAVRETYDKDMAR